MPSHGWHVLLPHKTVSPACLSTWLFWFKCTMPSWTCFSRVRWRTKLRRISCSSYFWTTDGSRAPLWCADVHLRGKKRRGKSATRQNAGFACACYLWHRFEKQFVTSNPASVDKSPENSWAKLQLFQRCSACFSFYPIWDLQELHVAQPAERHDTTNRTCYFLHGGHFYSFVPSCTVELLQSDWWKGGNVLTPKGKLVIMALFFSLTFQSVGHMNTMEN